MEEEGKIKNETSSSIPSVIPEFPIVFWTSAPIQPGDTVLAYGDALAHVSIKLARLPDGLSGTQTNTMLPSFLPFKPVEPLQLSQHSVKFILPDTFKQGVFVVRINASGGSAKTVLLNHPVAWWCQGDAGQKASPGGWIRIFGRCLGCPGNQGTTVLLIGPIKVNIPAQSDCYSAKANLPKDLPLGDYDVFIHNGFGGKWSWSEPLKIAIAERNSWPATVYNVQNYRKKYVFSWDEVPGIDDAGLIDFLTNKFGIEWIKTAKIEKFDDGKTIKISTEINSLSLKLNDEETEVILKIDGVRTDRFIAKMENNELNIYECHEEGNANDDAIRCALLDAEKNGGGIIYFPRGSYKLNETLVVPPRTILRGERTDLTHLYWTNSNTPESKRLDAVIKGQKRFGIQDLTITFSGANNGIIADIPRQGEVNLITEKPIQKIDPDAGDIFLHRVRMRWLLYSGHLTIKQLNDLTTETNVDGFGAKGFLLEFGGKNIEICDCDLYSSGNVFNLVEAKGALIARNRLSIGRCGWANFDGCDGVICEDNIIPGADNMVRQGVTFWSKLPIRNVYFARNTLDNIFYHDRECMTTDGVSSKYFGPIASATESSLVLPLGTQFPDNDLEDHTCFVLSGRGKGQWRHVVKRIGDTTLTIDRKWDVLPGPGSIIGVNHIVAHLLIIENTMNDASIAFQFCGLAMDCIVAENKCARAGGFWSRAGQYNGKPIFTDLDTQPQFFIQYLNNEIVEGKSFQHIVQEGYCMQNSVIGVVGIISDDKKWTWPVALCFVIRRNKLNSYAAISLSNLIEDVIVESNTISCNDTGIYVGPRCDRIVIRKNEFSDVINSIVKQGSNPLAMNDR